MRITLKFYAGLRRHLPVGSGDEGLEVEIEPEITPNQILSRFRVDPESAHLVLLNGVYVEPARRDEPLFKEGDVLAAWPAVAGG